MVNLSPTLRKIPLAHRPDSMMFLFGPPCFIVMVILSDKIF